MNQTQDFTKGVIWKQLLFFFFPILIGSFFQQLYNTVDTIIVGQAVGTSALAAVGSTGNLTSLIVNFYVGLSTGASVVIAQYYGAQNNKKIHQAVHTSYSLAIVSSSSINGATFEGAVGSTLWIDSFSIKCAEAK